MLFECYFDVIVACCIVYDEDGEHAKCEKQN